jgi:hypothetical protein
MSSPHHVNKLMVTMAHEMAHDIDTRGTHVHGPEFYENMVQVVKSSQSPTAYNCTFYEKMKQGQIDEKRSQEVARETKAQERVNRKLGIAASTKS